MNSLSDPTYLRIHQLVTEWLESEGESEHVRAELNKLLSTDERAVAIYQQYTQESAGLRWQAMDSEKTLREIATLLPQRYHSDRAHSDRAHSDRAHSALTNADRRRVAQNHSAGPSRHIGSKYLLAASLLMLLSSVTYWLMNGSDADAPEAVASQAPAEVLTESREGLASAANADIGSEASTGLGDEIATLTRLIKTQWRADSDTPDALSRLRAGEEIRLESGQAEILFDSGVEVVLTGPAHFKVESTMSASVEYGTFSARVGPRGKGFTIQTPSAEVVDLGTEFGLAVSRAGETEVAVFSGIVDLAYDGPNTEVDTARQRLNQGEALRVGLNGQTHRVVSIDSERFPTAGSQWVGRSKAGSVIEAVRDNLRSSHSRSFYRIVRGGFGEDATAFVDRGHQWNGISESGIPEFLIGADYVMPFNDDKLQDTLEVTLVLAKPAIVYLLFDNNMSRPGWLTEKFVDTNLDIGLDEDASIYRPAKKLGVGPMNSIDDSFSIWRREMPTGGPVVLGGVSEPEDKNRGYNMYGIVAVPMSLQPLD